MKKQHMLLMSALTLAIYGCGGDNGGSDDNNVSDQSADITEISQVKTQEQYSEFIENKITEISAIQHFATQPEETDPEIDNSTIPGIDNDGDGMRDSLERTIYQMLVFVPDLTEEQYDAVRRLAIKMTPSDPVVADSISEAELYCDYINLSENVKSEISFTFLEVTINNTPERIAAYEESITRMNTSLTGEVCVDAQ